MKPALAPAASLPAPRARREARRAPSHLAASPHELAVTELEQALICAARAFYRFIAEAAGPDGVRHRLSGEDVVIIQQLIASPRPRGIVELARFSNRDDIPNLQYCLRKLIAAGLVEKAPGSTNRDTVYQATAAARDLTEHLVRARRELLMAPLAEFPDGDAELRAAARALERLTGRYDRGTRILAGRDPD